MRRGVSTVAQMVRIPDPTSARAEDRTLRRAAGLLQLIVRCHRWEDAADLPALALAKANVGERRDEERVGNS